MTHPDNSLFVDTSIQIASVIDPDSEEFLPILDSFDRKVVCGYSLLEYKRALIQSISLVGRYIEDLKDDESVFEVFSRCTSQYSARRVSTLVNVLRWVLGESATEPIESGGRIDKVLKIRAQSYIRNAIMTIWYRFENDREIVDEMKCQRRLEKPVIRRNGTYDVSIHETDCRNGRCNNANFFKSMLPNIRALVSDLKESARNGTALSAEILRSIDMIEKAMDNSNNLHNYDNCLKVGDVWLHLEAVRSSSLHFATLNYKESRHLCPPLGLTMQCPIPPSSRRP